MTDGEMIAAFLAKNSATKIETGTRAYSDKALYTAKKRGGVAKSIRQEDAVQAKRDYRQAIIDRAERHYTQECSLDYGKTYEECLKLARKYYANK